MAAFFQTSTEAVSWCNQFLQMAGLVTLTFHIYAGEHHCDAGPSLLQLFPCTSGSHFLEEPLSYMVWEPSLSDCQLCHLHWWPCSYKPLIFPHTAPTIYHLTRDFKRLSVMFTLFPWLLIFKNTSLIPPPPHKPSLASYSLMGTVLSGQSQLLSTEWPWHSSFCPLLCLLLFSLPRMLASSSTERHIVGVPVKTLLGTWYILHNVCLYKKIHECLHTILISSSFIMCSMHRLCRAAVGLKQFCGSYQAPAHSRS